MGGPFRDEWVRLVGPAVRAGWLVVVDIDDHPDLIDRVHRREPSPGRWLPAIGAHAVQTSTDALASAVAIYNPEVRVLPNAVFELPPFRERRAGPATVFYGALNRETYSAQVAKALEPAIARFPDTRFDVVHDHAFFDALPAQRKRFRPALPYDEWLRAMDAAGIALLPLEGTPAERHKSDLKFLEAASRGCVTVASTPVYAETVRDGETGLLAPALSDWAPAIDRLLGDPVLRTHLARAAWEEVRAHRMFSTQIAARRDWYASLWGRREALHEALLARLPALRTMG